MSRSAGWPCTTAFCSAPIHATQLEYLLRCPLNRLVPNDSARYKLSATRPNACFTSATFSAVASSFANSRFACVQLVPWDPYSFRSHCNGFPINLGCLRIVFLHQECLSYRCGLPVVARPHIRADYFEDPCSVLIGFFQVGRSAQENALSGGIDTRVVVIACGVESLRIKVPPFL